MQQTVRPFVVVPGPETTALESFPPIATMDIEE